MLRRYIPGVFLLSFLAQFKIINAREMVVDVAVCTTKSEPRVYPNHTAT